MWGREGDIETRSTCKCCHFCATIAQTGAVGIAPNAYGAKQRVGARHDPYEVDPVPTETMQGRKGDNYE